MDHHSRKKILIQAPYLSFPSGSVTPALGQPQISTTSSFSIDMELNTITS